MVGGTLAPTRLYTAFRYFHHPIQRSSDENASCNSSQRQEQHTQKRIQSDIQRKQGDKSVEAMSAAQSLILNAFEAATLEFKTNLNNDAVYTQILSVTSIDEVYDLTDKLQAEQGRRGHLRHLAKIEPYLNRLRDYASVIEVFVQVKPDIMALIWGPIKLLLQWSSVLAQSFDAIVNTSADIGLLLPEFKEVAVLFSENKQICEVLVLFFKDILDFYQIGLRFFTMPRMYRAQLPSEFHVCF